MSDSTNNVVPVPTNTPSQTVYGLDPNSYTAQRLNHSTPEHLHLTSRRFFVGPIPEGWLNSNRKSWYQRKLDLNNYSSRNATFDAAVEQQHRRASSLLTQPSLATRMTFSFQQPEDVYDDPDAVNGDGAQANRHDGQDEHTDEDEDENEIEPTALVPVSTEDAQKLGIADPEDPNRSKLLSVPYSTGLDGARSSRGALSRLANTVRSDSYVTAREEPSDLPVIAPISDQDGAFDNSLENNNERASSSMRHSAAMNPLAGDLGYPADNIETSSRTALLPSEDLTTAARAEEGISKSLAPDHTGAKHDDSSMVNRSPDPVGSPQMPRTKTQKPLGVRFRVAEGIADRKQRLDQRADGAKNRIKSKVGRRSTLQDGMVIKMERMLVRIDVTMHQLPDDYDENESLKSETRVLEKWREYMVVARKSTKDAEEDFRLQMYKTRVIPEIDDGRKKTKPVREIRLLHQNTRVNLFSSLDKTVVIWHPYRKGTRTFILKPNSTAHAVEWYTFLRDALGLHRPSHLQVTVPQLDVALHVERPFERMEAAILGNADEQTILAKAAQAEQAVAGRIVSESMRMLGQDSEWEQVLRRWSETAKMGLAWKRYDRLEWVHGIVEKKMYGSMAMQHSYDLELRPKHHYPTSAHGKKGVLHDEPAPIEGFLIRLTSQQGLHKRFGKAYYKRLYFATYDRFLVFSRPAKATPPHPPRLATLRGDSIPSAQDIVREAPTMHDIDPYPIEDGEVKWLRGNRVETAGKRNAEAVEEVRRTLSNLMDSDGYIDMCRIAKVRKLKWGAGAADDVLESGDDVDFHEDVENTRADDGTTTEIDDDRTFELVLDNQLVIRLQAYSKETRTEWMKRLRRLVKYWKLRSSADITNLKATRSANLHTLNIDEEQEARLGQFAHKWEVRRSEVNPELWNFCRVSSCRTITMSGMLFRKPRRHSTFQRCSVLLAGGHMLVFQATLRKSTGEQIRHIHQDKQQVISLKDCYVYSGLIVDDDLLYQNRTFDANHTGLVASTPRVYVDDGWTASDVDVMTCFVVWMSQRKGWFRSVTSAVESDAEVKGARRSKLKRVTQLGVSGRGMVFKCRSRAERDLWVTAVAVEIQNAIDADMREQGKTGEADMADARFEH